MSDEQQDTTQVTPADQPDPGSDAGYTETVTDENLARVDRDEAVGNYADIRVLADQIDKHAEQAQKNGHTEEADGMRKSAEDLRDIAADDEFFDTLFGSLGDEDWDDDPYFML